MANRRSRIVLKIAGFGAALLFLISSLAVAVLNRPVRQAILRRAIAQADGALPGRFSVEKAEWKKLSFIEFRHLMWVDEPDTVVAADHLILSFRIAPLFRRDLYLSRVSAEKVVLNVDHIQRLLQKEQAKKEKPSGKPFFPRAGVLPGIPSIAVVDLDLDIRALHLSDVDSVVDFRTTVSFDFLRGHAPRFNIEELAVQTSSREWGVRSAKADFDLVDRRLDAFFHGSFGEEWPFELAMTTDSHNRFRCTLFSPGSAPPPEGFGVELVGELRGDGAEIDGVDFELFIRTPSTDTLAKDPRFAFLKNNLSSSKGLSASVTGSIGIKGGLAGEIVLQVEPNEWVEGANAELKLRPGEFELNTLAIRLPGLSVGGEGRFEQGHVDGRMSVQLSGTRWIENLIVESNLPDTLTADLEVDIAGEISNLLVDGRLDASLVWGGFVLNEFQLVTHLPGLEKHALTFQLAAVANGMEIRGRGEVSRESSIVEARFSPFQITVGHIDQKSEPLPKHPAIQFDPDLGHLLVNDLTVQGDVGTYILNAEINGERGGDIDLHCDWDEFPSVIPNLLCMSRKQIASMKEAWRRDGPFLLDATVQVRPPESDRGSIDATCSFILPGPETFTPLLPAGAMVSSLGPVLGEGSFVSRAESKGTGWQLGVNLGNTEWIDSAIACVTTIGDTTSVDSVLISIEGVRTRVGGSIVGEQISISASLDVPDTRLLARFVPALLEFDDLALQFDAGLTGEKEDPNLEVSLRGHLNNSSIRLPEIQGSLTKREDEGLAAHVEATQGLTVGTIMLDRLSAGYSSNAEASEGFLVGEFEIEAIGPGLVFYHQARVEGTEGWAVLGDTLFLSFEERTLLSSEPYRLRSLPNGVKLEALNLSGSLGTISGHGIFSTDEVHASLDADLDLTKPFSLVPLPEEFQADTLNIRFRAVSNDSFTLSALLPGVGLGKRRDAALSFDLEVGGQRAFMTTRLVDRVGTLFEGDAEAKLDLSLYPFHFELLNEPIIANAGFEDIPLPGRLGSPETLAPYFLGIGQEVEPVWNGLMAIRGRPQELSGGVKSSISFPGSSALSDYLVSIEAFVLSSCTVDSSLFLAVRNSSTEVGLPSQEHDAVFSATLLVTDCGESRSLERSDSVICNGFLNLALARDSTSGAIRVDSDNNVAFKLNSSGIDLSDFGALFPPGVDVRGLVRFDLGINGSMGDPTIDGSFGVTNIQVETMDGSRASATGHIDLSGTGKRPIASGEIVVQNGVIRIPDPPKALHPTQGDALLWGEEQVQAVDKTSFGVVDSVHPTSEGSSHESESTAIGGSFDIGLKIPGRFWIRGQGLEAELAGDLRASMKGNQPVVIGELETISGHLLFLGRRFTVEKGRVVFFGEDELDPTLDIALVAVLDGTMFRIALSGTALQPELELSSDPEMSEGDIMSFLVFGKRLDELDSDQTTFVKSRALEVAKSSAAAKLEERLSRELGLDMLTVREKEDGGGTELVMGKYINQRALLRYEQTIEKSLGFMINLEYWLARNFRIITHMGDGSHSGIEVNWSKDY